MPGGRPPKFEFWARMRIGQLCEAMYEKHADALKRERVEQRSKTLREATPDSSGKLSDQWSKFLATTGLDSDGRRIGRRRSFTMREKRPYRQRDAVLETIAKQLRTTPRQVDSCWKEARAKGYCRTWRLSELIEFWRDSS
jgi:hypothetical protein